MTETFKISGTIEIFLEILQIRLDSKDSKSPFTDRNPSLHAWKLFSRGRVFAFANLSRRRVFDTSLDLIAPSWQKCREKPDVFVPDSLEGVTGWSA